MLATSVERPGKEPNWEELGRLEPILGIVLAYGEAHPDVFGGYGLTWHSQDDGSAYIGVTRDVDVHRAALEQLVDAPDDLIVCRSPLNEMDRAALLAELEPELLQNTFGWSPGSNGGGIDIWLGDTQEDFAADLVSRYGERVEVTVGRFPYPMPEPPPPSQCEPLPEPASVPGLRITVDPVTAPITGGRQEPSPVTVRFTNTGTESVALTLHDISGLLVDNGVIVGGPYGPSRELPDLLTLAPGAEATRSVEVGTTTCDPAAGYRVGAGQYDLVVLIGRPELEGDALASTPVTVEVAAT